MANSGDLKQFPIGWAPSGSKSQLSWVLVNTFVGCANFETIFVTFAFHLSIISTIYLYLILKLTYTIFFFFTTACDVSKFLQKNPIRFGSEKEPKSDPNGPEHFMHNSLIRRHLYLTKKKKTSRDEKDGWKEPQTFFSQYYPTWFHPYLQVHFILFLFLFLNYPFLLLRYLLLRCGIITPLWNPRPLIFFFPSKFIRSALLFRNKSKPHFWYFASSTIFQYSKIARFFFWH